MFEQSTKSNAILLLHEIVAQLQNPNSNITEKLVSDFSVAMGRMDYTSDYVYDYSKLLQQYNKRNNERWRSL